jgi:hypothetical protein
MFIVYMPQNMNDIDMYLADIVENIHNIDRDVNLETAYNLAKQKILNNSINSQTGHVYNLDNPTDFNSFIRDVINNVKMSENSSRINNLRVVSRGGKKQKKQKTKRKRGRKKKNRKSIKQRKKNKSQNRK